MLVLLSSLLRMSFAYHQPIGKYRQHMNREGELIPANRERIGTINATSAGAGAPPEPVGRPRLAFMSAMRPP